MIHYAHSSRCPDGSPNPDVTEWQPLYTGTGDGHLERVAELAETFAASFGGAEWARLAGRWHDLGKYSADFQEYLRSAVDADAEDGPRRGPDHSTAGAQHAAQSLPKGIGHLLGYVIAGHHSGLPDGIAPTASCLEARMSKQAPEWRSNVAPEILRATAPKLPPRLLEASRGDCSENAGRLATFLRFVFSALIDADRLDTQRFCEGGGLRSPRPETRYCWDEYDARLHQYLASIDTSRATTDVNAQRAAVLDACVQAADLAPGFFSLTVPTGGGKTLSSLAFALRHASRHGLRRVVYAIPFTSIIEQNADVFRQALGADAVLEHHCNYEPAPGADTPERQLATENWDAPLVATTNVQFFESLFANRTGRCRKLHRIAGSIIILDEAQAIPVEYLAPCLFILRELVSTYGCTVVLCTATQPAIQYRGDFSIGIDGVREIVPNPAAVFRKLVRVRHERRGRLTVPELAAGLSAESQVLAIVRTRREAAELFAELPDDGTRVHLSGQMCAAHRTEALGRVRARLRGGTPCRLVSTNLIEAGVDVDFPIVYRALAGLDAIAQAAGRCNRGGLLNARGELGRLIIYGTPDETPVGALRLAAQDAAEVLALPIGCDPLSLAAVEQYFRQHFWSRRDSWDTHDVLGCFPAIGDGLSFRFATAAERFRFIADVYRPVVVPHDDVARRLIESLLRGAPATRDTFRAMQRYTVTIPQRVWLRHLGGAIQLVADERVAVLVTELLYDRDFGLRLDADIPFYNPDSTIC